MNTADTAIAPAADDEQTRVVNFYEHCDQSWQDTWTCSCNDDCAVCGREIEPYASEEVAG